MMTSRISKTRSSRISLPLFSRVEKSGRGVSVQASTLGSLEALLDFLKDCKIPVANVGIGPVFKRDVMAVRYHAGEGA